MAVRTGSVSDMFDGWQFLVGALLSVVTMVPHEFIHGMCFREDVVMYQNLKQGMLFVTGAEEFTKVRFIFMSLAPNIVFGVVPYIIFMIHPESLLLGMLGALSIPAGAGDYYNVLNTVKQVPKNAKIYLRGFHTYCYTKQK